MSIFEIVILIGLYFLAYKIGSDVGYADAKLQRASKFENDKD
jgi:hypothetical protein